jgi:hypothetical protein
MQYHNFFKKIAVSIIIVSQLIPAVSLAHPGRTNSSGCHICKTRCDYWGLKYGQYHCHSPKTVKTKAKRTVK